MTQFCETALEAVSCVQDGDTVLLSGFGAVGMPMALLDALIEQGTTGLTVVSNNAGKGTTGLAALLAKGQVRKMICTFPRQDDSWVFNDLYRSGRIELEVVPQGTLTERIRAAGAGIGAFYCPTGVGTLGAHVADRMGNLIYRKTARSFGPVMATAATTTVVQVSRTVEIGAIDPENIVTPSVFVDRVVAVGDTK